MTDEEINRKFDVVAQHLANLAVNLAVSQEQANQRMDRIEATQALTALQIEHLGRALVELTEAHSETQRTTAELQRAMARLAESQAHTDRRLDALIDIVRKDHEERGRREGSDEQG